MTAPTHETIIAEVAALKVEVAHLKEDGARQAVMLQEIRDLLNQGKGGWRVMVAAATIVSFISGFLSVKFLKLIGVQ